MTLDDDFMEYDLQPQISVTPKLSKRDYLPFQPTQRKLRQIPNSDKGLYLHLTQNKLKQIRKDQINLDTNTNPHKYQKPIPKSRRRKPKHQTQK